MKKLVQLLLFIIPGSCLLAQSSNFNITVRNLVQISSYKLEFDVYLLNTDPGTPFELASCQLGFLLNSGIYTGGTLSAAIDNSGSGLNASQLFTADPGIVSTLNDYPNKTLVRLAGRTPPGPGNGTIISPSGYGTLLTHFIITSTVSFASNTTPDLVFLPNTAVNPLYPTRVNQYLGGVNTSLSVTPGVNAIVYGNPVLNSTTGINSTELDKALRIYPNPVYDEFSVDIEGIHRQASYEIINLAGHVVKTGKFSGKASIKAASLPSGVYTLRLVIDGLFVYREIVKT